MSARKKPPLRTRAPAPVDLDHFLEGAERPRPERAHTFEEAPRREGKGQAGERAASPAGSGSARQVPDFDAAPDVTERFVLRLQRRHHAMLRWLSQQSGRGPRRRSMQALALDLLEPALEAEVERVRAELAR